MTLQEAIDQARGHRLAELGNRLPPVIGDVAANKEHHEYMTFIIAELDKAESQVRESWVEKTPKKSKAVNTSTDLAKE